MVFIVLQILLAKKHNVATVVVGGKSDVPQQYCGFVGGESVSFQDIDRSLKVAWPLSLCLNGN